jgi:hypothetical protein
LARRAFCSLALAKPEDRIATAHNGVIALTASVE